MCESAVETRSGVAARARQQPVEGSQRAHEPRGVGSAPRLCTKPWQGARAACVSMSSSTGTPRCSSAAGRAASRSACSSTSPCSCARSTREQAITGSIATPRCVCMTMFVSSFSLSCAHFALMMLAQSTLTCHASSWPVHTPAQKVRTTFFFLSNSHSFSAPLTDWLEYYVLSAMRLLDRRISVKHETSSANKGKWKVT